MKLKIQIVEFFIAANKLKLNSSDFVGVGKQIFEKTFKENYMQNEQNFHCEELKKEAVLVRISDVDLFSPQTTLSWQVNELNDSIIKELFDVRFSLMGGADKDFLKLHTFRVLSKAKIKGGKFCTFWTAKVQYLQDFFLPELSLAIKKNQFLFFHGRFTFWRVGNEWKARIC